MPRPPDLVVDSELQTTFNQSSTVHSFRAIDAVGRRFYRQEHWKRQRLLGGGGFGQVYLEKCVSSGSKMGTLRAVKVINIPSQSSVSVDYNRELEAIAKFSHHKYNDWFARSDGWFKDSDAIYITMEYCRRGDLEHYLREKPSLPATQVRQVTHQILEGLDHMHKNDFVHRDLKPGNILIKMRPPTENCWVVLADFGISKRGEEGNPPTTKIGGTLGFMAPELLGAPGFPPPKSISDFKAADMWALGEITYRMLTGRVTFKTQFELIDHCAKNRSLPLEKLPEQGQTDGNRFAVSLLQTVPEDRLTTAEGLQHSWMDFQMTDIEGRFSEPNVGQTSGTLGKSQNASARWTALSDSIPASTLGFKGNTTGQVVESFPKPKATLSYQSLSRSPKLIFIKELPKLHDDCINDLAFSPDGKKMASASVDKTVRLWDLHSETCTKVFRQDLEMVSIAFASDGRSIATISDRTLTLWDIEREDKPLYVGDCHPHRPGTVSFSPDGNKLAVGIENNSRQCVLLGDPKRLQRPEVLNETYESSTTSVAFSPDGKMLAYGSDCPGSDYPGTGGTVTVLDMRKRRLVAKLSVPETYLSIVFSPNSTTMAILGGHRTITLWNVHSNAPRTILKMTDDEAEGMEFLSFWDQIELRNSAAFSPDGKRLIAALRSKFWVWKVENCQLVDEGQFGTDPKRPYKFAWSPDCKTCAVAEYYSELQPDDLRIRLLDIK